MSKQVWHRIEDPRIKRLLERSDDGLIEVRVRRKRLALIRWQEQWYCLDARCPHQGGPLCEGFLEKSGELVCPWHRFRFNIQDGTSNSGGYFVHTYPVRTEGNTILIALPKRRFGLF